MTAHADAAAAFQHALELGGLADSRAADALFGLAESLQSQGETTLEVCAALPDNQLSLAVEAAAADQAAALFNQAVEAYNRVHVRLCLRLLGCPSFPAALLSLNFSCQCLQENGRQRVDAAVNAANTLCAWAEVERRRGRPDAALPLLEAAEAQYRSALAQEEDALTLSNLADSLVQQAEVMAEAARSEEAVRLYSAAADAFSAACQQSSSEQGDDLPGLLINWAAGLLSRAAHTSNPPTALALIDEACLRLRRAAEFERGDPAPLTALGEALVARAERLTDAAAAAANADRGAALAAAEAALGQALDQGYHAALRLRAGEADAQAGVAECHVELARLAAVAPAVVGSNGGAAAAAERHWAAAAEAYVHLLQQPTALGSWRERADLRYNCACACARAGRSDEAAALLRQLVASGAVRAGDLAADADLAGVVL